MKLNTPEVAGFVLHQREGCLINAIAIVVVLFGFLIFNSAALPERLERCRIVGRIA